MILYTEPVDADIILQEKKMSGLQKVFGVFIILFIGLTFIAASAADARKEKFIPTDNPDIATITGAVIKAKVKVDRMFLLIDTDSKKRWAAIEIPEDQTVEVGDTVTVEGVVMHNIHITGMKREFKRILYGSLVEVESSSGAEEK
jgi:hypothetical protein